MSRDDEREPRIFLWLPVAAVAAGLAALLWGPIATVCVQLVDGRVWCL